MVCIYSTDSVLDNLGGSQYIYYQIDAICIDSIWVELNAIPVTSVTSSSLQEGCNGNGKIVFSNIQKSSGSIDFTAKITNSEDDTFLNRAITSTTNDTLEIAPGSYYIDFTDNCSNLAIASTYSSTGDSPVALTVSAIPSMSVTSNASNTPDLLCYDGEATLTYSVAGGLAPFTSLLTRITDNSDWSDSVSLDDLDNTNRTFELRNLIRGNYTLKLTDCKGNNKEQAIAITVPDDVTAAITISTSRRYK